MTPRPLVAHFRFYEELNDFLPSAHRKQTIEYRFDGHPGIKDPIESLGVPHSEVELIIVNGDSVGFDYQLQHGDRVAVYPVFESFDVTPLVRLREQPLRQTRFVLDVNLGKLARLLRLCGFDSKYSNHYHDRDVVEIGTTEKRIILTRDRRLLYHRQITHGYWIRSTNPDRQLQEVIGRLDLYRQVRPMHRCLHCNGVIAPVAKADILSQLEPLTRRYYDTFYQCGDCRKVYWKGSHYLHMLRHLATLLEAAGERDDSHS